MYISFVIAWLWLGLASADLFQLREEIEELREQAKRSSTKSKEDRSFIWADEERSFPY